MFNFLHLFSRLVIHLALGLTLVLLSGVGLAMNHSAEDERAITRAAYQNQQAALRQMAAEFTGYNRAYALYRLASVTYTDGDPRQVLTQLREAAAILADVQGAEAATLRAAALSMTMGLAPDEAPRQGPLVQQLLAQGKMDNDAGPRARLIEGINFFYTPPAFGGDLEKAKQALEKAIAGFAEQSGPGETAPGKVNWGEAEAHLWLGQVELKLGHSAAAKQAFEQALTIDPECAWAEHWLRRV